jgi:ATP-dependent helicase/nuclease subunit B
VRVQFLLGPAGSGKTFRCLDAVRAALRHDPGGSPLVFLAPKQATFQIERQLLDGAEISGYVRLNILSFERLAKFVLEKLQVALPKILSAEGRVMVLRALLLRHQPELNLFRQSASRPGFALELSTVLAELQQHQFTPARLLTLSENRRLRSELQNKLRDLALLLQNYELWLNEHGLHDANRFLDFGSAVLRRHSRASDLKIEGLWLDGFAEMTPQELDFLAAIIPFCGGATLAFCLETVPASKTSRLSIWSAIGQTFQQCRQRLEHVPDCLIEIETLPRDPEISRFSENRALAHLEKSWAQSGQDLTCSDQYPATGIQIVASQSLESEAAFAACEILKYVRQGNRFRDCALLVRSLEGYHQIIARTFRRHGIPFFLDRRESVAHHPLTELTRSALRLVAFDWQHNDWFAALKSGFCAAAETDIDRLENNALQFGWRGRKWREPLPDEASESIRKKIFPPFESFWAGFSKFEFHPTGAQLAGLLRELWRALNVEPILESWTFEARKSSVETRQPAIHATVFEQMNAWLDNLALAFPDALSDDSPAGSRTVQDWLPILEAGLTGLTIGVIPPVLDEVLVGAVDRARNPNLKFVLVAGVNESVFPAAPATPPILTNFDRTELENENVLTGPSLYDRLARERYLGYIACTRATERLVVTFARQDNACKAQNPSSFIAHLQNIFPHLAVEDSAVGRDWREAQSAAELVAGLVLAFSRRSGLERAVLPRLSGDHGSSLAGSPAEVPVILDSIFDNQNWKMLAGLPVLKTLIDHLLSLREPDPAESLSPAVAQRLYGLCLNSSVSRLEEFAQCPFRFFVHSGLRAGERKVFELDARERGTFQHEILRVFHERLVAENLRWRDLTPAAARESIGQIAGELAPDYRGGLFHLDAQSRFDARILTLALQDFVGTLITWMHGQYEFDPVKSEWAFGMKESPAPSWIINLLGGHQLALRGKIDRIDLCRDGDHTLAVVTDYKSRQHKLDNILFQNGIQLQLLAYLAAIRNWPSELLGAGRIFPAGVFYVNLRGQFAGGGSREEVLADTDEARRLAYRHAGRFDAGALDKLDRTQVGDQFSYRLNDDGTLRKGSAEAQPRVEFLALLDQVEVKLREMGENIFAGSAQVDPYRKGTAIACDYCDYRPICRIDPWTHQWRVLRAEKTKVEGEG